MGLMTNGGTLLAVGTELANHADCCCGELCDITDVDLTVADVVDSSCTTCEDLNGTFSIVLGGAGNAMCGLSGFVEGCIGFTSVFSTCSFSTGRFFINTRLDGSTYRAYAGFALDDSPPDDFAALWLKTSGSPFSLPLSFGPSDLVALGDCSGYADSTTRGKCDFSGATLLFAAA